ncbi:hypothetical protein ETD86_21555 [Nonomuraea turkmeniaca]|uniref:Uncharacterized protein n=1 Tax=Nonomuraea turkmeniaca TaxID=103838 RepID=A0A5S4FG41_9ACTN|nr:hypothetical protein [Nonomuraea turkmeniaca]TMR18539.1 hypothetical protein ETD86_21555 [Nonomuraea turkmeniaca]
MSQDREYVGFVPGDGWMVTHHEKDGTTWHQRVVAWAFDKAGEGHPITSTDDADASVVSKELYGRIDVWHPDLAPPAFDGMDVANRPPKSQQS